MKLAASLLSVSLLFPLSAWCSPAVPGPIPSHPNTLPPPPPPGLGVANGGRFGTPLPGLTGLQRADFDAGKVEFRNTETVDGGLGPIFNDVSCVACHFQGGAGGASRTVVTRFGAMRNGVFDPLIQLGGPLLQKRAISPELQEVVPKEANVVAHRVTTPLFGAGLVEAIPDSAIMANAAKVKPDGIKGRAAMVRDPISATLRVGRFGWKAQHATLDAFAADAYLNEMGVTSRYFPNENAPNGKNSLLAASDKVLDPEDAPTVGTEKSDLNLAADFMRFLAPVPRLASNPAILAGEAVFAEIGCAVCHLPVMKTGAHPIAALSGKPVNLYSDLLLHEMGRLGDGIEQLPATANEMRTPPLWGLRLRDRYLHDGRASTLDLAIQAHDGEAKVVRDRYVRLPISKRQLLVGFLDSL